MKRIILLLFLASACYISNGQSILLDPNSSSVLQVADTDASILVNGTDATPFPSLKFSDMGSFRGALWYQNTQDGFNLSSSTLTPGYFWARTSSRAGIGTFEPEAKLHIYTNGTTAIPQLRLTENNNSDGARITFSNFSSTNDWTLYGKTNNTSSEAFFNIYNSTGGNIITVRGDGKVGILNSDPALPFHVNSSAISTSSSTGAAAIGVLTSTHLIFDNNEINAYSNTTGTTLFLNEESGGRVEVGGFGAAASDLRVNGFTELGGSGAPSIKMKKLSGTIPLSASSHSVAHGLTKTKILGVQCLVESSATGNRYLPNDGDVGSSVHYEVQIDNSNIVFQSIGANMDGEPFSILITYEE